MYSECCTPTALLVNIFIKAYEKIEKHYNEYSPDRETIEKHGHQYKCIELSRKNNLLLNSAKKVKDI